MLKDAPKEGFEPITFFRSPLYATLFGLFLLWLFPNLPAKYYVFAVAGGERILSECYKKILNGREPGKFKKKLPIKKGWKHNRWTILPIYTLDLTLIFLLLFVS